MPRQIDPQAPEPASGDFSTTLWGKTFLPLGQGPAEQTLFPTPKWAEDFPLLREADPERFYTLDFLRWTIGFAVGQRLCQVGEESSVHFDGQAVNAVSIVDPEPFLATEGSLFRFPLLALYRTRSRFEYVSTTYPFRESTWKLLYVLPRLGYATANKLEPVLVAIEKAIDAAVTKGFHPQYAPPGGNFGDLVWGGPSPSAMGVEPGDASWESTEQDVGGLIHVAYRAELKVRTRLMDVISPAGGPATRGAPVPLFAVDSRVAISAEGGDAPPNKPIVVAANQIILKTTP